MTRSTTLVTSGRKIRGRESSNVLQPGSERRYETARAKFLVDKAFERMFEKRGQRRKSLRDGQA